jgi:hypothetical protein
MWHERETRGKKEEKKKWINADTLRLCFLHTVTIRKISTRQL